MTHYEDHLKKIIDLIDKYENLISCHLIDFLKDDLWNKFVPMSMKSDLEEVESKNIDIDWWKAELSCELNDFKNITKSLKLDSCPSIKNFEDWSASLAQNKFHEENENVSEANNPTFMKHKKWHEVDIFSQAIANLTCSSSNLVIDAGAGKAYLSEHLSKTYDIPVLAIESSKSHHNSALSRKKLIKRKKYSSSSQVQHIMRNVDKTTDYSDLVNTHLPEWNVNKNIIMIGLHTCGTLSHSITESFVNSKDIKCLCVVPCCYHLMTDSLTGRKIFSKNARMLAQQSLEKTYHKAEPLCPTLFYRTILEVLLSSMGLNDAKVGRGAPLTDFPNYAQWALRKIGVPSEQIPSIEFLERLYKSHVSDKWKFEVFQLLRIYLSPVIEAAIILDIVMYLQQKRFSCKTSVVKFFDCEISPRNDAVIATK